MKVSIIIPVYNVEAYITKCLESVAQQTYRDEMECLIVDDCGTDNSICIAQQFIHSYQGNIDFRVLHHDHNRGLSAARNTGVKEASGDYIYFLDSDDAIIPETIEEMMGVVQEFPQVEMVQGGIVSMDGKVLEDFTTKELPKYTNDTAWIAKNILLNLSVTSWNRLMKREFLIKENITFYEGIIHEDVPYNYMLATKCRYVGFVKKNTYIFRTHRKGSITNTPQEERTLRSRIIIMNECLRIYRSIQKQDLKIRKYALCSLWRKLLTYMVIYKYQILMSHEEDISNIIKQLCIITPWNWKVPAILYSVLPLKIKRQKLFLKIINRY